MFSFEYFCKTKKCTLVWAKQGNILRRIIKIVLFSVWKHNYIGLLSDKLRLSVTRNSGFEHYNTNFMKYVVTF